MMQLKNIIDRVVKNGFKIRDVYDVGACAGAWTRYMRSNVLPDSRFYLFEANMHYMSDLIITGHPFFLNVLSNEGREFVDFYPACNTGDSYYKETTKWFDNMNPVKMPCTTLDILMERNNLPVPNFLKIDTQGSELDILSASKKIVGKTELILCEMPIIEYNSGAPNTSAYLEFFFDNGYVPIDVAEIHRAEDILLQLDLIFMLRSAKDEYLGKNDKIRV